MKQLLIEKCKEISIDLSDMQVQQFLEYYESLIKWNEVMNLTAITEYEDVVQKHFVDSIAIVKMIDMKQVQSVIDVGTGAGFPGVPLKIVFPHLKLALLDSLNKRIKFLQEITGQLNLGDVTCIHGRAEDFAKKEEHREQYDLCVSRAVANLSTLSEYCIPYVKKNGFFISYKSGNIDDEIEQAKHAIDILGGKLEDIYRFELPGTDMSRSFVMIHKMNHTSKKYPRKAGLPAKEPL